MKKYLFALTVMVLTLTVIVLISACATPATGPDALDIAIRDTSDYLNDNIPKGNKIVILNIQSDHAALSEYIIDELIANAVNDRVFSVVDRAQLDQIRMELNFHLSGEVSDQSALEIGKFLGAQTIVSGAIGELADRHRMRIRALNVQTAEVQGQYNRNIAASRTIAALMKGGRSSNTNYGTRTTTASGNTTSGNTTSSPQGSTTAGRTAQPAAQARLANGTYTFRPRPQAYKNGIPMETYIFQIVVRGNYLLVYLGNSARGPAPNSWVYGFNGDCMLTNLDNPSRSWTTRSVGEKNRDLGNTIFSFQNVTGNRFSLENLNKGGDNWTGGIFEEFDINKAEYEP
jgi:hypothetical protein